MGKSVVTLPQKSDPVLIIYSCVTNDPKIYQLKNVLSHSFYGIWEQLSRGKGVPFGVSDWESLSRLQPGLKSSQGSTGEGSTSKFIPAVGRIQFLVVAVLRMYSCCQLDSSLSSFRSLLKCHLLPQTFPDPSVLNGNHSTSNPFPSLISFSP